ncbi:MULTISPECIES: glucose-6-phosphate dehydrogenase assembly protein OpcA [Curtobacterium]|jgi:glucose-6-phosphate dehydrogenase assembly protein OpcA|uniref:Glucose-6-phosphate dehydrogenase assembly protein OpcA n=1 Tax=Curtobacterium citri TaxID=3055139 RepID=A0ABT7T6S5_9MICO|nr:MULTISPECIES: glucose-6-phosphate dehydrogenase assembly protein OpcA [Curtobacterium]MDM7885277.1 glucose-6-phosphate dehydrogenase assembly protein OpcA [Curtobacterium citri]OEI69666.1 OpcA protein [Curtobacterium sp. ER1/6]
MKIDLPNTTVSKIQKKLVHIREEGGAVALGRVLTLIISTGLGHEEEAISAANEASREHPMRVIIVSKNDGDTKSPGRLDAQIRVGSDAGASEVIVLRAYGETATDEESLVTGLLLPDAPVVAWWPQTAPEQPAASALGRIAQRRITDAAAQKDPNGAIEALGRSYVPGDTDFAWTRLTLWRNQLAAALDQPPYESITSVEVSGASDSPSTILLAAWLRLQLQVPVAVVTSPRATGSSGIHGVKLERASGPIDLERSLVDVATLSMPGQPTHDLSLPRRNLRDCLAEELRRLDPDVLFGDVVKHGVPQIRESIAG